ncbi:4-alpha-glucanotransferase, partial [Streptomyces sp. NPDC054961]
MDDLARLAALYGVATTYQPAEDVTVRVPESTVAAVARRLGADADTPGSLRAHLAEAEHELSYRLLPQVLVWWAGSKPPAELGVLPPGTLLRLEPEQGGPAGGEAAGEVAEVWPEGAGEPPRGGPRGHPPAPPRPPPPPPPNEAAHPGPAAPAR